MSESNGYEQDEFDAASAGPVGVHRAPRNPWAKVWPPLLAFVLVGLLTFGAVFLFWNRDALSDWFGGSEPAASPTPSVTATAEASPTPSVTPSATPSPTPTPSETAEPEPVIDYDAAIAVRNGAGITGLAGQNQTILTDAGFTDVDANDLPTGDRPGANTVQYTADDLADTAALVAETLGIDAVEQVGSTPGGTSIEVLLVTDPSA